MLHFLSCAHTRGQTLSDSPDGTGLKGKFPLWHWCKLTCVLLGACVFLLRFALQRAQLNLSAPAARSLRRTTYGGIPDAQVRYPGDAGPTAGTLTGLLILKGSLGVPPPGRDVHCCVGAARHRGLSQRSDIYYVLGVLVCCVVLAFFSPTVACRQLLIVLSCRADGPKRQPPCIYVRGRRS